MADRVAGLFLKQGLGLPGHAGLGEVLHQEERRLPVVDVGEDGASVLHLSTVNHIGQLLAASLDQRCLDLPGDALEFGVGHRELDARLAEVGQSRDLRRVGLRHHDGQRVGDIGDGRRVKHAIVDQTLDLLEPGEIGVGLYGEGHIADRDRAVCLHLLDQQPWRDRLPEQPALVLGVRGLECLHQRRHGEVVVAADEEDELGVTEVAVEVGHVVDLRHGELEAALERVIVLPVLPGRKHFGREARHSHVGQGRGGIGILRQRRAGE